MRICSGLTGRGSVSLLYPRQDGKFGSSPSGESARETVHSPEALDEWHRDERPWRAGDGAAAGPPQAAAPGNDLAALIGPLPPSPLRNELEFAVAGL